MVKRDGGCFILSIQRGKGVVINTTTRKVKIGNITYTSPPKNLNVKWKGT